MNVTAFDIARRFAGIKEVPGIAANAQIVAMLQLDNPTIDDDSVAWCSGYTNYVAWLLGLPRSKSLSARSWLRVGIPVDLAQAKQGFDVVILKRGQDPQPGPAVINAPGHVAFFAQLNGDKVILLGGNQGDSVRLSEFPVSSVLGVRRLRQE